MDEKKVSSQVYSQTEEYFISKLHDFMRFYQEYRVIHGKTKHGFTIRTNVTIKPVSALSQPINFENSIIQALIRKPIRTQGVYQSVDDDGRSFDARTWKMLKSKKSLKLCTTK